MAVLRTILMRTWRRAGKDNLSGLAAGVAFYALFSIFPALTAVVSLYRLAADPKIVERQVTSMEGALAAGSRQAGGKLASDPRPRPASELGAVMILLLCFDMSAYVTLVGAELNAEKEREA